MTLSVKHAFASAKSDGGDPTIIQPSNWNAEHTITMASGKVMGRDASSAGAAQELPLIVDVTGQSLILPTGTTAQQPATPVAGMLRYNTTTANNEQYVGGAWIAIGDFADSSVTTAKLADGAATTVKIADTAVTFAKLATALIATAAGIWANTSSLLVTIASLWSAAATVTLTDTTTIAVDMGTFINAVVTLAGNRTLGQPSNTKVGQTGRIRIIQDGTGTRTLAFHADWKFAGGVAPILTTTAAAEDVLYYEVLAANRILGSIVKDVK